MAIIIRSCVKIFMQHYFATIYGWVILFNAGRNLEVQSVGAILLLIYFLIYKEVFGGWEHYINKLFWILDSKSIIEP